MIRELPSIRSGCAPGGGPAGWRMGALPTPRTWWAGVVMAAVLCALAFTLAGRPADGVLVGAGIVFAAVTVSSWRRGVFLLLALLPFSGVPVFLAGTPGQAFRDAAIVLPLYAAFAFAMSRARAFVAPPLGIAMPALAVFAALVLLRLPAVPSLLTGVIATKVWLAYLPMLAIGYHYARRIEDFDRALRVTALLGLIPAVIAIAECIIASRGEHAADPALLVNDFGWFRYLYGDWYERVHHSVVSFYSGGGHVFVIARVPSTFTSSTQFHAFALVAFAAGLSQALRSRDARWAACSAVLAVGTLASGARVAYVTVPLVVVLSLVLARPSLPQRRRLVGAFAVAIITASATTLIFGANPVGIAMLLPAHLQQQMSTGGRELAAGMRSGLAGQGTGSDTQAALRYTQAAESRFIENWYAKVAFELGPIALAAIVVAVTAVHLRLITALRGIDVQARQLAAPVVALLIVMTLALFKGPYIDLDPLNVYFWLLAGMLLAVVARRPGDEPNAPAEVLR